MKIVVVNHSHPSLAHISATRSWFMARNLADQGHEVVQISRSPPQGQGSDECEVPFIRHATEGLDRDWSTPHVVGIPDTDVALASRIRSATTPAVLRKVLIVYSMLAHGGVATDLLNGSRGYVDVLADSFRPEVVWGVYGGTECWLIAQRLARLTGCPWVADMKDSWDVFVPAPLRQLLAYRFRDMAACTANSEFNARVLERRFGRTPTVVYSGVDTAFMTADPAAHSAESGCFRLTLTGSLYTESTIDQFVRGVRRWLVGVASGEGSSANTGLEIAYAGPDSVRAEAKLGSLRDLARVQVHGYLPLPELAALCRSATANAYLWCPTTFHHKLLELLSCGRPVIAFPGETEESHRLAARCGGDLRCTSNENELVSVLEDVRLRSTEGIGVRPVIDDFTWAAQARILESVFEKVVAEHRR
jgi:glycosyltransferase involved in cell wall biosynthesis